MSRPLSSRKPVIGAVSFLNTKPLIDGLENNNDVELRLDVPARLLDDLLRGEVDIALCPVVDYQLSPEPLVMAPVGGICCDGPTLTVRLFSRVPFEQVERVATDADSHTSVMLMRIVLHMLYGTVVEIDPLDRSALDCSATDRPQTMLLIGDKVVATQPDPDAYPHQLDLGEAWKQGTGMPFVFATWLALPQTPLAELAELLSRRRLANADRIDDIVARHAGPLGWPDEQAGDYLKHKLGYAIGPEQLQAIRHYWSLAHEIGLIEHLRPLVRYA